MLTQLSNENGAWGRRITQLRNKQFLSSSEFKHDPPVTQMIKLMLSHKPIRRPKLSVILEETNKLLSGNTTTHDFMLPLDDLGIPSVSSPATDQVEGKLFSGTHIWIDQFGITI